MGSDIASGPDVGVAHLEDGLRVSHSGHSPSTQEIQRIIAEEHTREHDINRQRGENLKGEDRKRSREPVLFDEDSGDSKGYGEQGNFDPAISDVCSNGDS